MSNQSHVVVAYDFSHSGRSALYRAIALAKQAPFHELHFVCVIEPHGEVPSLPRHGRVDYAYAERVQQALTDEVAAELKAASITDRVHFFVHARIGKPAREILELAREVGADLIIIGSKGATGVERLVLGSVSEKVVREASCTVEVARPKTYEYVELLEISDVEPQHRYVPPHRYTYDTGSLNLRPVEWPLY
ncbi:MAG TPA: universal stress protein [Kofleriaceae bacterium]|nr:universal stress protein [Kofleriaceae bacterium]